MSEKDGWSMVDRFFLAAALGLFYSKLMDIAHSLKILAGE